MTSLLLSALALGALGTPHCLAMCGGIAGGVCAGAAGLPAAGRVPRVLAYNTGRLASYGGAGFVAGSLGGLAGGFLPGAVFPMVLRGVVAVLLIAAGMFIAGRGGGLARLEALGGPVWRALAPLARRVLPARTAPQAVLLGLVWGWLPCGLVYSALALAFARGSAGAGALTMVAFGIGTLPAMLGAGAAGARIAAALRFAAVRRAAGLALVASGVVNGAAALLPSPGDHGCPSAPLSAVTPAAPAPAGR